MIDLIYGFDLGDGETATSFFQFDSNKVDLKDKKFSISFIDHRMTAYYKLDDGSFSFEKVIANAELFCNFKKQPLSLSDQELKKYSDILINYCNLYFDEVILKHVIERTKGQNIRKIVFCIGHPTDWKYGDIKIYKEILCRTRFGQNELSTNNQTIECLMFLEKESRAAFLHYQNELHDYINVKNRLLIDVGSSTIDITAVSGENNISIYNSGHNYLGARIIDYSFREFVLNEKIPEEKPEKLHLFEMNQLANNNLLLECRDAKEKLFNAVKNSSNIIARIDDENFEDFRIKISLDDFSKIINSPIKEIIKKYKLCEEELDFLDSDSWCQVFKKFVEEQKINLERKNFEIEEIIFSGNASLMYFVPDIFKIVFGNDISVLWDKSPGIAIANGLVLCVLSNAKSNSFKKDADAIIKDFSPRVIEEHLSGFASIISSTLANYISDVTYEELIRWKREYIKTLKEVKEIVVSRCASASIIKELNKPNVKEQIRNWYSKIFVEVNGELKKLAQKNNISFESTRGVISVPEMDLPIPVESIISNFAYDIIETSISGVFDSGDSLIGASFALVLQAVIMIFKILADVFVGIISIILSLFDIDLRLPSDSLTEKMQTVNFPGFIRKKIKDSDLRDASKSGEQQIKVNIEALVHENKFKNTLIERISQSFKDDLEKTKKAIQYIIESRASGDVNEVKENMDTFSTFLRNQIAQRLGQ